MKDTSLYQQILGDTTPWSVGEVRLDAGALTIEVRLVLKEGTLWACPECRRRMHIKEWRTRRWRHLDSCQFKTVLEAKVPVVECSEHGAQTVQVPWAEGSSRFTLFFERLAVEVLLACSVKKAAELLAISWDEADGIKQRAVQRGLAQQALEGLEYVCVDEKAVGLGHDYVTVVTALRAGKPRVVYVGDGRAAEGLNAFWELLGPEGCKRIKAVSMDMGLPYQNSTRLYCPNAEIIFDPFHIMKMFNKAVDEVRRTEAFMGSEQARDMLKKSRQLWLYGEENLPSRYAGRFQELKSSALKTARAWGLKELWRSFKRCANEEEGLSFFKNWYREAMRSRLTPIKKLAKTLQSQLAGILTYLKHRFCNAFAEGVNSRIQLLIQKSCGYRNRKRLKTDILFHFGALNLKPAFRQ
jgi:transposase